MLVRLNLEVGMMIRQLFIGICLVGLALASFGSSARATAETISVGARCTSEPSHFIAPVGITDDAFVVTSSYRFAVESYSIADCSLNWRRDLGPQFGETLFTRDVTYAATSTMTPTTDRYELAAIDNQSGAIIWSQAGSGTLRFLGQIDGVVITAIGNQVQALRAKEGTVAWTQPFFMSPESTSIVESNIIGFTNPYTSMFYDDNPEQEIVSIEGATGHINWRGSVQISNYFSVQGVERGVLIASDLVDGGSVVRGWDLASGAVLWERDIADAVGTTCRYDGACVMDAYQGDPNVIGLIDPAPSKAARAISLGFAPIAGLFRGKDYVAIGPCDDPFDREDCPTQYALIDFESGTVKWAQVVGGPFMFPNLHMDVIYDDGLVYFDARLGIVAMHEVTGEIAWLYVLPEGFVSAGFKVLEGNVAVAVGAQNSEFGNVHVIETPIAP
jgi:outer membrane protein assembly factor BamB